jgi:hypothetical protein
VSLLPIDLEIFPPTYDPTLDAATANNPSTSGPAANKGISDVVNERLKYQD